MTERRTTLVALFALSLAVGPASAASRDPAPRLSLPAAQAALIEAAMADTGAWTMLESLCDEVGPRLNGSDGQQRAIAWAVARLRAYGLENVHTEPVTVPRWIRGEEQASLVAPYSQRLPVIGLGGTVGTPPGGIEADVLVVTDFAELERRAGEAAGKIVLFDPPWEGYGRTVRYRIAGADAAARHGAVACLIRSAAPDDAPPLPHTGIMHYAGGDTVPRIPAAALTVPDAARLHRLARRGVPLRLRLVLDDRWEEPVTAANVVAEWRGRERPEEIVLLGGHLDSWDVGCCAQDDGVGVVMTASAVRLMIALGLRPRRTVRLVLFADEEMTGGGGKAYLAAHRDELPHHVAALESDSGCFAPDGFSVRGDSLAVAAVARLAEPLVSIGADHVRAGWSGADVGPIVREGVPGIGHRVDGRRYFHYHHSDADLLDAVDPEDLRRNVAAIAALVYAVAETPNPLPRGAVTTR